jgi:Domain of unknown function (DUF4375)
VEDLRIRRDQLTQPDDAEHVWWDVIERVYDELQTPYEPDPRLGRLTPGQRALYALHWTRSEVENGGFHQYLQNPTGMLANEAVRGADLIEAREFADVLRDLVALFPAGTLLEAQDDRIAFLERLSEGEQATLSELDERFFELMGDDESSRLALRCASYVENHPDEFFLPLLELRP